MSAYATLRASHETSRRLTFKKYYVAALRHRTPGVIPLRLSMLKEGSHCISLTRYASYLAANS